MDKRMDMDTGTDMDMDMDMSIDRDMDMRGVQRGGIIVRGPCITGSGNGRERKLISCCGVVRGGGVGKGGGGKGRGEGVYAVCVEAYGRRKREEWAEGSPKRGGQGVRWRAEFDRGFFDSHFPYLLSLGGLVAGNC